MVVTRRPESWEECMKLGWLAPTAIWANHLRFEHCSQDGVRCFLQRKEPCSSLETRIGRCMLETIKSMTEMHAQQQPRPGSQFKSVCRNKGTAFFT